MAGEVAGAAELRAAKLVREPPGLSVLREHAQHAVPRASSERGARVSRPSPARGWGWGRFELNRK